MHVERYATRYDGCRWCNGTGRVHYHRGQRSWTEPCPDHDKCNVCRESFDDSDRVEFAKHVVVMMDGAREHLLCGKECADALLGQLERDDREHGDAMLHEFARFMIANPEWAARPHVRPMGVPER